MVRSAAAFLCLSVLLTLEAGIATKQNRRTVRFTLIAKHFDPATFPASVGGTQA